MEEKIQKLYQELRDIAAYYLIFQMRDNIERTKKVIPEIQGFVLWFMEENRLGIEDGLYEGMCNNLVSILSDLLQAMEQRDMVLLHDALSYGLLEYMQYFLEEVKQEEDNSDDL